MHRIKVIYIIRTLNITFYKMHTFLKKHKDER